jgi:hypothetical protein
LSQPVDKRTRLERYGMRYLRTSSKSEDATLHILTLAEQQNLRAVQRQGVFRAALAGALSAAVSGAASALAPQYTQSELGYWLIVGIVTGVASVLEIAFLYADGLRAVREMAAYAGLNIDPEREEAELALALCRAALELPSPPDNSLGVDPYREVTKLKAIALSLLYKAKIALTSFILKAILRRALGRVAVRSALEFVAVPVTAAWNAIVAHWVLTEARLRIVGPSAVGELAQWIESRPEERHIVNEAVACVIVKARAVHPNVELLARQFLPVAVEVRGFGDLPTLIAHLEAANENARLVALRALCAAAIVDGRLSKQERTLLTQAFRASGREVPLKELEELRRHMVRGDGLRVDLLSELSGRF